MSVVATINNTRTGKQLNLIKNLPKNPKKNIIWIVYNLDMVAQVEHLIEKIHGSEYMKHVKVVHRSSGSKYNGSIYFDPSFYDLISNGEN